MQLKFMSNLYFFTQKSMIISFILLKHSIKKDYTMRPRKLPNLSKTPNTKTNKFYFRHLLGTKRMKSHTQNLSSDKDLKMTLILW